MEVLLPGLNGVGKAQNDQMPVNVGLVLSREIPGLPKKG